MAWIHHHDEVTMRQFHAIVSGRVQGVCFRAETQETARRLGLSGFVRNLPDGSVEVVAEGEAKPLGDLLEFLHQGPPLARVHNVDLTWDTTYDAPDSFTVRY